MAYNPIEKAPRDPYEPHQHLNYAAALIRDADAFGVGSDAERDEIRLTYESARAHIALAHAWIAADVADGR